MPVFLSFLHSDILSSDKSMNSGVWFNAGQLKQLYLWLRKGSGHAFRQLKQFWLKLGARFGYGETTKPKARN